MAPRKGVGEAAKATKDIREAADKELGFDPLVDAGDITVKNMKRDVALNGTVPSYPQYLQAAAAAKRVQGVTKVHNHLMVTLPTDDYRDDPMLTTAANNALEMTVTVPGNVEASATDGNVWLTGVARNRFERDAAEQAIAGLTGVRGIADVIEIFSDVEAADVTELVQDALDRYAVIADDSDVLVNASDGTITLTGHVRTGSSRRRRVLHRVLGCAVRMKRLEANPVSKTSLPRELDSAARRGLVDATGCRLSQHDGSG